MGERARGVEDDPRGARGDEGSGRGDARLRDGRLGEEDESEAHGRMVPRMARRTPAESGLEGELGYATSSDRKLFA